MARLLDVFLEEEAIAAEGLHRLATGRLDLRAQLAALADDLHPFPAATGARLDEEREADALGLGGEIGLVVAVVARHDGNAEALHEVARVRLRAHRLDRGGPRADEDDLRLLARGGQLRTLGEEEQGAVVGV